MTRNKIIDLTRYPRRVVPLAKRPGERTVVLSFPRPSTVEGGELPPAA